MVKYAGAQAIGLSIGLIWLTLISTFFGFMSIYFLKIASSEKLLPYIYTGLTGLALLTGSGLFLRKSIRHKIVRTVQEKEAASAIGKKAGIWFGIVVAIEVLFIVAANILTARSGHAAYLVPVDILIVGLHFIPLAKVFNVPPYYFTGIATSAICIFCLLYFPASKTIGGTPAWILVPGNGFVFAIWATVIYILAQGLKTDNLT